MSCYDMSLEPVIKNVFLTTCTHFKQCLLNSTSSQSNQLQTYLGRWTECIPVLGVLHVNLQNKLSTLQLQYKTGHNIVCINTKLISPARLEMNLNSGNLYAEYTNDSSVMAKNFEVQFLVSDLGSSVYKPVQDLYQKSKTKNQSEHFCDIRQGYDIIENVRGKNSKN